MSFKTPLSIKNALYSDWWFEPAWQQMHSSNAGNNLGVVVGANGSGKSWLLGWVAETLGVTPEDKKDLFRTDFLSEHLFFDSRSFIQQCNKLMKFRKRLTVGYQLILDEGQLSLYSKEAFNEEVKNLSRMLMTIRSRRWGVYINLPSFGMLNKDVRIITNWMVQMRGKPTEYSYGTFYEVMTNMVTGEPYLKKPVFSTKQNTPDGVPLVRNVAYSIMPFPKPSINFIRPYERMKAEHQKLLYEKFGFIQDQIVDKELGKNKVDDGKSIEVMADEVLNNISRFQNKKKEFVRDRFRAYFGCGVHRVEQIIELVLAKSLTQSR